MTGEQRFEEALPVALQLAAIVHGDGGPSDVERLLAKADVPALCVALAALVPVDATATELLAWADTAPRPTPRRRAHEVALPDSLDEDDWTDAQLRAAHARAYAGDTDLRVRTGERIYQRFKARRQREKGAAA